MMKVSELIQNLKLVTNNLQIDPEVAVFVNEHFAPIITVALESPDLETRHVRIIHDDDADAWIF